MNSTLAALNVFRCLVGALLLGRALRRLLPGNHLSTESEDAEKLAMVAARRMWPGEVGSPGQLAPTCKQAMQSIVPLRVIVKNLTSRTRHVRQLDGLVLWRACHHSCRGKSLPAAAGVGCAVLQG